MKPEFEIQDDFPPFGYDEWRALVEADLKGATFERKLVTHTYEGIDIQPLYTRRDRLAAGDDAFGVPGFPPFVRGSQPLGAVLDGWDLRQEHAHPDIAAANQAILDDLEGGVTSLHLVFDAAASRGLDPDDPAAAEFAGRDGLSVYHLDDLDAVLAGVDLSAIGVALDAGAAFLPVSALLIALWRRRGVALEQARGALNADPLAALAREGGLPMPPASALAQLVDLAQWTAQNLPHVRAVGVDTSPYHHAGATAAQDIAFGIATSAEYLRAMTAAGMDIDAAARQFEFQFSLGTHHFLAIAKLRAARELWSRVVEASGGVVGTSVPTSPSDDRPAGTKVPATGAMRIHARTSRRVLTQRDPYVNLLRNAVGVFAAGIGGADAITSVPFDVLTGLPDEFSRRVARNTLLILQEEAHLHRVIDPAAGSWFLDQLTAQLAESAWAEFQQVERQGGMLRALESGWIAQQIDSAFAPRAKDIARRKEGITGVSEFPDVAEERVVHAPPDPAAIRAAAVKRVKNERRESESLASIETADSRTSPAVQAAADGASIGQIARALAFHQTPSKIQPLEPRSFAEPFEELRDAADAYEAAHGRRPTVFLANMGPVSQHTARTTYAKNFFEAGGFAVITGDGFRDPAAAVQAFTTSGASIVVICSSDQLYIELVPQLASQLKVAGARSVVLAGNPGDNETAWRAAGVDRFIFIKCDVLATLREMLQEEGVLES
jgi:methylmalonyl-CoA mutase